jgi:cobalt-zinc-cadmium resistance protein CzcA
VLILLVLPVLISRYSTRLPLSQRKKKHDPMVDDQDDTTTPESGVPA